MRIVRLHPLYDGEGEIGAESVSVETPVDTGSTGTAPAQETPNETPETKDSESSFAKRLREHSEKEVKAAREAWEKETGDKYKDYDVLKTTAEFFREKHGYQDLLSMKEEIELVQLQERAEKEQVPPEVLKRIDQLEAKAAKGEEIEKQYQQEQVTRQYFDTLGDFVKDKGVTTEELNQFMIDNEMQYNPNNMQKSFEFALKAYKADEAMAKLETAKKDAIDEYLGSKRAPKAEGSPGSAGFQTADTSKMSWKELNKHAAARLEASKQPQ